MNRARVRCRCGLRGGRYILTAGELGCAGGAGGALAGRWPAADRRTGPVVLTMYEPTPEGAAAAERELDALQTAETLKCVKLHLKREKRSFIYNPF